MGTRLESRILVRTLLDPRAISDLPTSRAPDEQVPTVIVFWAMYSPLVLMVASISSFRYEYEFGFPLMTKDVIVLGLWHSVMRYSTAPSSGWFFRLHSSAPPGFLLLPCGPGPSGWCTGDIKVQNGWPTFSLLITSKYGAASLLKRRNILVEGSTVMSPLASRPLPPPVHGS